ncbi:hypothetical protein Clacol_010034 [Clathrus columnatus]|uniref:Uncharacterized protein n=1 Tax=Clathrus columnatus TaxID=1419009 RepID=A0AAV5ATV6_9AGAM|nr:hypothetical protein Clacol_010034 [Clathrus columnatus]
METTPTEKTCDDAEASTRPSQTKKIDPSTNTNQEDKLSPGPGACDRKGGTERFLFTVTALNENSMIINLGHTLHRIIRPLGCAIVFSGLGVLLIGIIEILVAFLRLK